MAADAPPPCAVPREPLVDITTIHPALEKMARAICLAEGHHEDEHWFDYNPKRKVDMGGPAWTAYLEHASLALKVLETLDLSTLMRGTAAFSWDTPPPPDDEGDLDSAPDLDRALKALVAHIQNPTLPVVRPQGRSQWDETHFVQRKVGDEWRDIGLSLGDVVEFHSLALAKARCGDYRRGDEPLRIVSRRSYRLTEDVFTEMPA
ncbi:hypothetical protein PAPPERLAPAPP_02970 [Brevundimonas phage vB_BpoS-Papperlapapp]|nr:hypothetical protein PAPPERLAPAPP_02970 [Brevundimonas phage vB_BpoS-Papperlapapp]